MKLYEKIINGKYHCKPLSKIVLIKDDMQIFNPSEEMLLEDGWKIHVPKTFEISEEEYEAKKLQTEIENIIYEIKSYDSSVEINSFYVNDEMIWLDKFTRTGLMLRLQSEQMLGDTETTLWYGSKKFVLPIDEAMSMLYKIEKYASQCYDTTQMHIANVETMTNIDDIKHYDYTSGYPEKLRF